MRTPWTFLSSFPPFPLTHCSSCKHHLVQFWHYANESLVWNLPVDYSSSPPSDLRSWFSQASVLFSHSVYLCYPSLSSFLLSFSVSPSTIQPALDIHHHNNHKCSGRFAGTALRGVVRKRKREGGRDRERVGRQSTHPATHPHSHNLVTIKCMFCSSIVWGSWLVIHPCLPPPGCPGFCSGHQAVLLHRASRKAFIIINIDYNFSEWLKAYERYAYTNHTWRDLEWTECVSVLARHVVVVQTIHLVNCSECCIW